MTDPMRILVVDDDADVRIGTARLLEKAGYSVDLAEDGEAALEAIRQQRPDLILLDRTMPGLDGLEVCRRIKQDPAFADMAIVLMSGVYTDSNEQASGLDAGADGYIARPIANRELLARVQAQIRILSLSRALQAKVRELEVANDAVRQGALATLNLLEDAREENEARKQAEAQLRKSEEMMLSSQTVAHICSYSTNLNENELGKSIWVCSPEFYRIFGIDEFYPHTIEGWAGFIHPDHREELVAYHEYVVRNRTSFSHEYKIIRINDEAERWVHGTGELVYDEHGNPARMHGAIQDITERKQAEEALLRSEALQGKMISNIGDVIVIIDEKRINRYKSENVEKYFGWKPEEVVGENALANVHPDDLDSAKAFIVDLLKNQNATGNIEVRYRCKDGSYKWISFTGCNLLHDPDIHGILGNYHDITEHKRAEQERLRLSMAMEQATDAVIITDRDGAIQYVNPAFVNVTGYSRQEALGQNPRFLKSGQQDAAFYRRMWAMLAAGKTWSGHMINKRKDGTLYEEDATISPVRDASGSIVNFVAVKRDVTREVQLEAQLQQAQKMESVGRLAGGVAHDFNNLLMGIMGYTNLCLEKIEPGHPIREYLDEIIHGANRSAEITRQLLVFARKQTIAPRVLDLNDAVAAMLKLLRRLIGEDIKLTWRLGPDLQPVKLDPSQVDQILANLCVNARDAIAGVGEVTLETGRATVDAEFCAIHPEATPGAYACLAVSDDGCGMDQETLKNVFEPFFTTKPAGEGTGLGLATVYGIVKQNNGFINVYSEPGKGSTFKIYLPQVAVETAEATVASKAEVPRGQGETVLLAEDEKSLRVTCGLFLKALGYNVLVAETPKAALKMVSQHPGDIHVLLTDVVMPGMDGRQLAQRISSAKSDIKVLFMSGYTADVIANRGVLDEGVQFLSKPFSRDDLAYKLRQVLDMSGERAVAPDKIDESAPPDNTAPGANT